ARSVRHCRKILMAFAMRSGVAACQPLAERLGRGLGVVLGLLGLLARRGAVHREPCQNQGYLAGPEPREGHAERLALMLETATWPTLPGWACRIGRAGQGGDRSDVELEHRERRRITIQ